MIADKIKFLREKARLTQSDLAKKLGLTRASVNAWEMGISVPSTQYIVFLAETFKVSTDYILGTKADKTINIDSLTDEQVAIVYQLIQHFAKENNKK